jgi:hypothetical protein
MSYSDPAQHKAVKALSSIGFLFPGALEACRHCHGIQIWVSGQTGSDGFSGHKDMAHANYYIFGSYRPGSP